MQQPPVARIIGMGSYLPERVLTNLDLEKMVETNDEWILARTGIRERRIAAEDEFSSDMGAKAAEKALADAGIQATDLDLILVATATPDHCFFPSTACLIQRTIGATGAGAVDMGAACAGHIYALATAKAFVDSGIYRNVLVVSTEKFSSIVDYTDRSTCVLFGDGASAVVVSNKGSGFLITTSCLGADGRDAEALMVPAGGCKQPASVESVNNREHYIKMVGRVVFKNAVREMVAAAKDCLERSGIDQSQVSWLVPHQANLRIIEAVAKRLDFPLDQIYKKCVELYGNNSAASCAIAMDELTKAHEIKEGEHLLLVAFGAGFAYGGAILTKIAD